MNKNDNNAYGIHWYCKLIIDPLVRAEASNGNILRLLD